MSLSVMPTGALILIGNAMGKMIVEITLMSKTVPQFNPLVELMNSHVLMVNVFPNHGKKLFAY